MSNIRFRPHHFLCTVGFEGKGYSESFVENYARLANGLRATPEGDSSVIEVVGGTDSICEPCPNRRGDACETEAKIRALDNAHAAVLGLRAGDHLTWGEAKAKIRQRMTLEKFHAACAPCAWLKAGMCEKALLKLRAAPPSTALFLVLGLAVFGATLESTSARADPVSDYELRRNALRTEIIGKKPKISKSAKALAKASKLLDDGKYGEAITAAGPVERDAEFADHALAIKGTASIREAEVAIAAGDNADEEDKKAPKTDWKKIESDALRAHAAWAKIIDQYLYSPWYAGAAKEIGKSELAEALAKVERKANGEAQRLFEKAFQRLTLENGTYLVRPRHLDAYADLCLKKKTEVCAAWILKFGNQYSKNSAESKLLAKKYPEIIEAAKPTFANSKVTTGYKQKDADEVAFDDLFPMVVEENWSGAVDALKKFLEEYPRSTHRFRARYWLATVLARKSAEDAKLHYEQLVRETPLTVYGLLAMFALKESPEGRFKGNAPELIDHDDLQSTTEATRLGRVKKLIAAKADRLAAIDLRSIRSRDTASGPYLLWLSSLASVAGSHLTTFAILSDLIARADENVYSSEGLDLVFPIVEWPTIEKQGSANGVDPVLILSLIKQESAFEREASSGVGASGYMQLMPFTASDIEADVERRDLLEAETNIRIGTKYLKKLLDKYKGNSALALAAYNAGPTAVDRWIREGRASRSFMEFVEQIPYKETRDYVGTIFRNYVWYKFRIKGERVTTADAFWPGSVSPKDKSAAPVPTDASPTPTPTPTP
jgi:soluble lytic murein transglycosylase-like protein